MVYLDRIHQLDEMTIEVEMNRSTFSGELRDLHRVQEKITSALRETLGIRTDVKLVENGQSPQVRGEGEAGGG